MGSDGSEFTENLTYSYSLDETDLTLYYHHHSEDGDNQEILYSYYIPRNISDNVAQTYTALYDDDNMSMFSNEITNGIIVYFSKTNDVKEWIVNDLQLGEPNILPNVIATLNVLNRTINNKNDDYNMINYISKLYESNPNRLEIVNSLVRKTNRK